MRTLTGAQTCTVENGSTFTTAIGKAAEGAEGAAAELVAGKVICAADGTAANTAMQAVTAIRRQPRVVRILLVASIRDLLLSAKLWMSLLVRWRIGSMTLQEVLLSEATSMHRRICHVLSDASWNAPGVEVAVSGRVLPSKSDYSQRVC